MPGKTQDDSALDKKKLEKFSVPKNSTNTLQAYRGDKKEDVIKNAILDTPPIRNSGENTITTELHGAAAYARGIDGKQEGAISSFSLDKKKVEEGIRRGLLIEKKDDSRDHYAGRKKYTVSNIQALTPEGREFLKKAVLPGSVKAIDQDIPGLFKPTKAQEKRGVTGLEAAKNSLTRSNSDVSKMVPSDVFQSMIKNLKQKPKSKDNTESSTKNRNKKKTRNRRGKRL